MFRWGIIFLVIALIAAALGFGGLAGTAAGAAKIVFVVGIILFLVSLFTGRGRSWRPRCRRYDPKHFY